MTDFSGSGINGSRRQRAPNGAPDPRAFARTPATGTCHINRVSVVDSATTQQCRINTHTAMRRRSHPLPATNAHSATRRPALPHASRRRSLAPGGAREAPHTHKHHPRRRHGTPRSAIPEPFTSRSRNELPFGGIPRSARVRTTSCLARSTSARAGTCTFLPSGRADARWWLPCIVGVVACYGA